MAEDRPTPESVEAHIRALDDQLAALRRLDAALDERAERTQSELRELRRRLAALTDARERGPAHGDDG